MSRHWDPAQYERFEKERAEPFHDLLALVESIPGGHAVDLGCGTGTLTKVMHETSGAATTLGIDSSPTMLANARPEKGLSFKELDVANFVPSQPYDLVFSNAALQWLPDHETLFERLAGWVAPGGQTAIQLPANQHHISHTLAREIAGKHFGCEPSESSVLAPESYSIILDRLGFRRPIVSTKVYLHHLPGPPALVEWVEGTLLKAYRARLNEAAYSEFNHMVREALLAALPDERPYRFTFPRILIHARKPGGPPKRPNANGRRGR